MPRDYNKLASVILVDAYNSKSTIDSFALSLQKFEEKIKHEIAQQHLKEWVDLDKFCKECDTTHEKENKEPVQYRWCDFSCLLQNHINSVITTLGYNINKNNKLVKQNA